MVVTEELLCVLGCSKYIILFLFITALQGREYTHIA